MSEPMRFNLKHFGQISTMEVAKDGEFVLHSDYARLKAEVERLRHLEGVASSVDFYQQENEKLNEEIERLTMIKDACKRMIKRRDKRIFELKAELAHLRASSFVTAVPVEEYEKLQAEVERLTAEVSYDNRVQLHVDKLAAEFTQSEVERLKAEVERLTERNKFLEQIDSYIQGANENAYEKRCDELEAEVERLRKAGDALYESEIGYYGEQILVDPKHHSGELCRNWNAAKEGKQP